jgi:hypothetical protein
MQTIDQRSAGAGHQIMWETPGKILLIMLASFVFFGFFFFVLPWIVLSNFDPWRGATVIRFCHGSPIVQRTDGTLWLRHGWDAYRVIDVEIVCR